MVARILLVEDDPVSREVIASMLTSRGYEVDTADDGFGALSMAQDTNYGLVFIDYHLPEMDGYALARLMRSLGEKTNPDLKMVAITADQFGLAARRGVDKIFDRLLTKPIAPDDLFAFVDEALGSAQQHDAVESFFAPNPLTADGSTAPGLTLWRARGLDNLPTARIYPSPTASERASIEHCFRITEDDAADCIVLLRPAGLAAVETFRREAPFYLIPLVVFDPELKAAADVLFEPSNGESWSKVAEVIGGFAARRDLIAPARICDAPNMRIAAYLFVADRTLDLYRGQNGQVIVPYTAGFPVAMMVDAVRQLTPQGVIDSKLEPSPSDGQTRLVVMLTALGVRRLKTASAGHEKAEAERVFERGP